MKIERELMRGAGPVAVLKLLERKEMYGYELVEALSQRSSGLLAMGQSTLYPMLYNLEAKGLIKSRQEQAPTGRTRRYYSLTGKGKQRLAKDARQWQIAVHALAALGITPGTAEGAMG